MKIIDNRENYGVEFVRLNVGDSFLSDKSLFVKISDNTGGLHVPPNAFNLNDNETTTFAGAVKVCPVSCEVTIQSQKMMRDFQED